ncbi:MAG: CRISPR-associated endonuclease Cas1 [Cyanobacteria bacterium REEB417]|nr:CRISPR-associated endonuclease Cas1 [Cyanobacteria bacterium REEB417]
MAAGGSNGHWLGQLQTLTNRAPCPNHLRGLEGSAAALYFRSLGGLLEDDGFRFAVRSRQPSSWGRPVEQTPWQDKVI